MFPYVILMFAPLLVYQVALTRRENQTGREWSLSIGKEPEVLNNSLIVPLFFLLYFLILSLRHELIGRDLQNYKHYFDYYSTLGFRDVVKEGGDTLYFLLTWAIGKFTDNYQVFLVIIAALTVFPIAKVYSEDKQYGFLKIVLFS